MVVFCTDCHVLGLKFQFHGKFKSVCLEALAKFNWLKCSAHNGDIVGLSPTKPTTPFLSLHSIQGSMH